MFPLGQSWRNLAKLLATGQLTQYGGYPDDGYYKKGIVKAYTILTTGQFAGNTNITINSKTDVHANACVFDNNTGKMWSRTCAASVGPASDGKLPWTTTGAGATAEGIFPYVAAANAALLAGYSDWRAPNIFELLSLIDYEAPDCYPDAAVFPGWPTGTFKSIWTSTTAPSTTANAFSLTTNTGSFSSASVKTGTGFVILVRG